MTFLARYSDQKEEYYRTVHADTLNDAIKQAEKLESKGFILTSLKGK